jgi:retron-type reverse transcriptase
LDSEALGKARRTSLSSDVRLFFLMGNHMHFVRSILETLGLSRKHYNVLELSRRLGVSLETLNRIVPQYRNFKIPKSSGGFRDIMAPEPTLKELQRTILRRLLSRLPSHPSAHAYEKNHSIVTHALSHVGKTVLLQLDLKNFFPSTHARRIKKYFYEIGWDTEATNLLLRICTYQEGLPQGAPTSPKLSNLVNYRLDERLTKLGKHFRVTYSRYADDMAFSSTEHAPLQALLRATRSILDEEGYQIHEHKKLRVRRSHQRQLVTGLIVNKKIALPRERRRWLRSIEHHLRNGRGASLNEQQLQGWKNYENMISCAQELRRI